MQKLPSPCQGFTNILYQLRRFFDAGSQTLGFHQRLQFLRLTQVERDGFIRHHVKTRFQRRLGHVEVHVVGRGDAHKVHAFVLGTVGFGGEHFAKISVAAILSQPIQRDAGSPRTRRIAGKRAARKLDLAVKFRGHAMYGADERALAAPDKPHP